jgi:hypothetical protein
MDRNANIVFGFHGTDPAFAERLIRGEVRVEDWVPSRNQYDWLGHGIYFWEQAPDRAKTWASHGGVVGAIIRLGTCLDLTDTEHTAMLAKAYVGFSARQRRWRKRLPANRGKLRDLDCAVINYAVKDIEKRSGQKVQTVRGAFLEGDPVFPGSAILSHTHIQIAVRDVKTIIGVFRPTF